jgi:thymidylate kinase
MLASAISMPLFYVTGVSGSGKSAVLRELESRGIEAHGVDEHGFASWVNRKTGEVALFRESRDGVDFPQWRKAHKWVLNTERIRALSAQSDEPERSVFLCGVAEGDALVWDAFRAVFALIVDVETIKQRIRKRTDHSFGKGPGELERILDWHESFEGDYRRFGAVIIDATRPVEDVVDDIVAEANG